MVLIFTVRNRENGENRLDVPIGQKKPNVPKEPKGNAEGGPAMARGICEPPTAGGGWVGC